MGHSGFGTSFRIMFALHLKVKLYFIILDFNFIISNINILYIYVLLKVPTPVFAMYFHLIMLNHLMSKSFFLVNLIHTLEITRFDCIFLVNLWMMLTHRIWPKRKSQDQILDQTRNGLEEWPDTCTYLPWTFCKSWTSPCSMEGGRGHSTLFP